MIQEIEAVEKQYKFASEVFAAVIVDNFPIGRFVMVKRGNGYMPCTIFAPPCAWSDPSRIGVRHNVTGKAHWVSWRDLGEPK